MDNRDLYKTWMKYSGKTTRVFRTHIFPIRDGLQKAIEEMRAGGMISEQAIVRFQWLLEIFDKLDDAYDQFAELAGVDPDGHNDIEDYMKIMSSVSWE